MLRWDVEPDVYVLRQKKGAILDKKISRTAPKKTRDPFPEAGSKMVPKVGVEPTRVSPQTPQACASTNSTTSAIPVFSQSKQQKYYFAGAGGGVPPAGGNGIAGADFTGAWTSCITVPLPTLEER